MSAIITLTIDFGINDAYVAVMKGVILTINPRAQIIDICHTIEPQNIREAAFILSTAYPYFPKDTIHLVVVDPGVGTERKAIILKTNDYLFVGPDNGVLSYPFEDAKTAKSGVRIIELTNPHFWRSTVSNTFHGRDVFAPVAAHLSMGVRIEEFGPELKSIITIERPRPVKMGKTLVGHVIHIDRFGNLVTDIKEDDLPDSPVTVEIAGRSIDGLNRAYAESRDLLALIGSSGHLEISLTNGSAAAFLKVKPGTEVNIKKEQERHER